MTALDPAVDRKHEPDHDVAAETFNDRQSLARLAGSGGLNANGTGGQAVEDLLHQRKALLDLANANPHPRIDIAFLAERDLEIELAIGRIGQRAAGIEGATRGPADESPRRILAGERDFEASGAD